MVKKPFSRLIGILTGARGPEGEDELASEDRISRPEKFAHFCVLVWKSFFRSRCPVRASALSFSTLLALIPLLAVAMSVTSSLLKSEGEERIYQFVDRLVAGVMPPVASTNAPNQSVEITLSPADDSTNMVLSPGFTNATENTNLFATPTPEARAAAQQEVARYIHGFIQNTSSATLGVTGMILLIFVAIRMLASIEEAFNDIWGVARGRNWFRRIVQYWAVITLGPLLLAFALGLSGSPHFQATEHLLRRMPLIGSITHQLLPMAVMSVTFALLYQMVPNTKVQFGAAMVGGVVAGSLLHLNNLFGFLYVSRLVTNTNIYGSLGLVPVFMAGIYLSWFILLFGAQIAYAFQNRVAYLQEKLIENVNQRGREFIALRLMTCIGYCFHRGLPAPTTPDISRELGVPSRLIQQVLQTLTAARLVIEVATLERAYAPARPLETINAHHILMAMRALVGQELITRDEPVRAEVYGEFARIQEAEKQAASSISLLDLVNRAQTRLELAAPIPEGEKPRMVTALTPPAEKS